VDLHALTNNWWLFHDKDGTLKRERQRYNAAGEHLIGYPYIDHTAGLSMWVHYFCQIPRFGPMRVTKDMSPDAPGEGSTILVIRFDTLRTFRGGLLPPNERARLKLPDAPTYLADYKRPDLDPIRRLAFLDLFRAPGFPDDVQILLIAEGFQAEGIWARIEGIIKKADGLQMFDCVLINQPHQPIGVNAGERVEVAAVNGNEGPLLVAMHPPVD
jgi:hypothetical protein